MRVFISRAVSGDASPERDNTVVIFLKSFPRRKRSALFLATTESYGERLYFSLDLEFAHFLTSYSPHT